MSTYLPPLHINQTFNSSDYDYQNQKLTLSTTEQRYLKKTGADYSYANTTFQNQVTCNNYALNCNAGLTIGSTATSIKLSSTDLTFSTSSTERLRIQSSNGYIGINKTTPSYLLDVNGTLNGTTIYENTTSLASKYSQLGTDNTFTGQNTINNNLIVTGQLKVNRVIKPNATYSYIYNLTDLTTADDYLVGRNTSDTLTNKTLTSPTLNTSLVLSDGTILTTGTLKNVNGITTTTTSSDIATLKTILTGATYDSVYNYLNFAGNVHIYGGLNISTGLTVEGPGIYYYMSNTLLTYLDPTSSIQTQFDNITSNYAKLNNINTFTNNQNIYKNIYVDDAAFNSVNYMQLCLSADGTNNGHNSVVGIDFTTWTGRSGGASTRIYGLDNSNYSAHLVFATASPGYQQYASTERMRIQDNGYIGIGKTNPSYLLDVNGTLNGNTIYENGTSLSSKYATITALNSYVPSQCNVAANATTGTFYLVFTNNSAGGTSNLSIGQPTYEATGKILKVNNIDAGVSNSPNIYNSSQTGTITIGGGLTTGKISIGNNSQTGTNIINGPTTFTGNATFNNTITGNISGNAATATTTVNVGLTSDTTTASVHIPFTTDSTTQTSASLRINPNLKYNAITNALTATTFYGALIGYVVGDCTGSSGSCTGNAETATTTVNVGLTSDTTTTSVYIPFTSSSATTSSAVMKINSNLKYNASTNVLTATTFTGALVGNVTGNAETATTSTNIGLTTDITTASAYIPFTSSSVTTSSAVMKINSNLKYNASTNALTATTFTGALVGNVTGNAATATTTVNVGLTSDTTTASAYIPFTSSSATTSSAVMKINSNLKYNASTNALTATTFTGALVGNVTGDCSGSSGSALTVKKLDITSGFYRVLFTDTVLSSNNALLFTDSGGLCYDVNNGILIAYKLQGNLDGLQFTNYSMYASVITGNIDLASSLTTGTLNIGNTSTTGAINISSSNINIGVSGGNTTINGLSSLTGNNHINSSSISTISTGTTSKSFSKIVLSANGEIAYMYSGTGIYQSTNSGLNWVLIATASANINDLCCSYTGQYVYYCTSAVTNKPQVSYNFGQTWANTGFNPGPGIQKIGCSYDGQIVVMVSGFSSPAFYFAYLSLDFGATSSSASGGITANTKTVNSVAVVGTGGSFVSVIIACGTTSNNDYVYYGSTMASIASLTSLGSSAWNYAYTNSNNNVYLGNVGNGLYISTNNGASFTQNSGTSGQNVYAVSASYDNSIIAYATNFQFYYSVNSGSSFISYGSSSFSNVAMSAMGKTCLILPTSTTDTIYSFNTNQNLTLNNDVVLPKQRLTLQSNVAYNYGSNTNIYYPYRTMILQTATTLSLTYPLYENYIITPSATTTLNLPALNEYTVGLKITVCKLAAQILTLTPTSPNLIFAYNVYTGATSYGLPASASSCILLASYGTTTSASKFCWLIISQA